MVRRRKGLFQVVGIMRFHWAGGQRKRAVSEDSPWSERRFRSVVGALDVSESCGIRKEVRNTLHDVGDRFQRAQRAMRRVQRISAISSVRDSNEVAHAQLNGVVAEVALDEADGDHGIGRMVGKRC